MKILVITIISLLLLIFWCVQFLKLMDMKAEDFSSREDKVIWSFVFIILGFWGAFLFFIKFKPKQVALPPLDLDFYEEIKKTFPEFESEIERAIEMSSTYRYDLEKWYGNKCDDVLINRYKFGPTKEVEPGSFGVLLAVLKYKKIETQ